MNINVYERRIGEKSAGTNLVCAIRKKKHPTKCRENIAGKKHQQQFWKVASESKRSKKARYSKSNAGKTMNVSKIDGGAGSETKKHTKDLSKLESESNNSLNGARRSSKRTRSEESKELQERFP